LADFAELLNSLINPGEDGPSPTIYDDLSASYTEATSTRDAKIQVTEESLAQLQAELLQAKAANWDLLQSIPSGDSGEGDEGGESDGDSDNDGDSDADNIGDDDDFFEDKD
jgi:hypothetical protein